MRTIHAVTDLQVRAFEIGGTTHELLVAVRARRALAHHVAAAGHCGGHVGVHEGRGHDGAEGLCWRSLFDTCQCCSDDSEANLRS